MLYGNRTEQIIKTELDSDEECLWSGQPKQGMVLRAQDTIMIPFSLVWTGFAIFWEVMALKILPGSGAEKGPGAVVIIFPLLWGLPFVLVGLYWTFGRFIVDSMRRKNTYYGVTNERIIIVSGIRSRKIRSLDLRSLTDISLIEKRDNRSTIIFGQQFKAGSLGGDTSSPGTFPLFPPEDLARNYNQELRALKQQGFIIQDTTMPGGWRVRPLVFLWWLTDAAGLLPTGSRPLIEAAAQSAQDER